MDDRQARRLVYFLQAACCLEADDDPWLRRVTNAAASVTHRAIVASHSLVYDTSAVSAFRATIMQVDGPSGMPGILAEGLAQFTPHFVARTFRSGFFDPSGRTASMPPDPPRTRPRKPPWSRHRKLEMWVLRGLGDRARALRRWRPLADARWTLVAYVALGQSTKETAYALGISDTTVRVHLKHAATKLGVRTRADLLRHPQVEALRPQTCAGHEPE